MARAGSYVGPWRHQGYTGGIPSMALLRFELKFMDYL
jgi:hypothetical protein